MQILEICMNIENIELQYKNRKRHIYPRQKKKKNFTWRALNRLCPKVGFFLNNKTKKPNKIKELQTVKNTKERSTEIWQNFSKNIL